MSKVFAIYPIDKSSSTSFLNRIHTFETRKLGDAWHCYKVHFSDEDHENCIKQSIDNHFVLFMGHGCEDHLCGACAKSGDELFVDSSVMQEDSRFYNKDNFIDESNIAVFKDKILFCFSCFSNRNTPRSLARLSICSGVEAFVGFGNLPTDYIKEQGFSKRCIAIYKGKIIKIMKYSLYYAIEKNETVRGLVQIIKLLTCKEIQTLRMQKSFHGKDAVIMQLYKFKNDIKIYGNIYSRLF